MRRRNQVTSSTHNSSENATIKSSKKLVTHSWPTRNKCFLFAAVVAFILSACLWNNWSFKYFWLWLYIIIRPDDQIKLQLTSTYLASPLTKSFSLDFQQVLKVRENNMKWYDYSYDRFGVDRRKDLSLEEYRDVYDGKWPVIVQDVIPTWKASNWSHEFLCKNYGQERVVMKGVHDGLHKASSVAVPLDMFCLHTNDSNFRSWTYVEDELFIPMRPSLRKDVGEMVPGDEDFFLLFPVEVRPWNSMLLWGTPFSRSSLHIDPYNWTGTNAVVAGLKKWRLYHPGQDQFFYIVPGRKSEFPLNCYKYNSPIDSYDVDDKQFPDFRKATYLEFLQYPGELLIIPPGWFHQAFNVKETIAISSQFANINNYRIILEEILKVGNIERNLIPLHVSDFSPREQVKFLMSMLPEHILNRGRRTTEDILAQMKED